MASHGVPRASGAVDRSEAARKREVKKIETYKSLVGQVQSKIQAKEYTAETLVLTSGLLSQNPEYYTVWNNRRLILQDVFRKELAALPGDQDVSQESAPSGQTPPALNTAQQEILLLIQEDLAFLLPLLKNFPKCYWIWNHRSWLLQQASDYLPPSSANTLWQGELGLVSKMLSYDSRNFHGWSYRRETVRALERLAQQVSGDEQPIASMTEQEFAYTTKMIRANLSNFSAWHNRLQLIPKLLRERNADGDARRKLLDDEFDLITQALYTDPYDQSIWFYHNYLMSTLASTVPESSAIVLDMASNEKREYIETQLNIIKDVLEGADDCKYIYQALLTYAAQYLDVDAENKTATTTEMTSWLHQLEKLDPLRIGRWQDLRKSLSL